MVLYTENKGTEIISHCVFQAARTLNCRKTVIGQTNLCSECLPNYYFHEGGCVKASYGYIDKDFGIKNSVFMLVSNLIGLFVFMF